MTDRLVMTREIESLPVEIYERTVMVPNPALSMVPMPIITLSFYVMPAPDWPHVNIRARRGLARLFYTWGRRPGISLENEHFVKSFRVDSDDEDFAVLLLTPEIQAFLLDLPGVNWSLGRGAITMFTPGRLVHNRIDGALKQLGDFRRLIDPELFTFHAMDAEST
jgi:hypothetical protein